MFTLIVFIFVMFVEICALVMMFILYCRMIALNRLVIRQIDSKMNDPVDLTRLSRFYVCRFCNFRVCERFSLPPREIIDDECPMCESTCDTWYSVVEDGRDCRIYYCGSCNGKLCHCSIESILRFCPWCGLYNRWTILSSTA
jgi:hypothetical protein